MNNENEMKVEVDFAQAMKQIENELFNSFLTSFIGDEMQKKQTEKLFEAFNKRGVPTRTVMECLAEGKNYAIDNTNPTKEDRKRYIPLAKENGYKIVGYFMESKIKDCIERNALREGKACVPIVAIASTSKKLEIPSYDEGFDELYYVKNDGENMTILPWKE